jgi:hypothetical protein
MAQTTEASLEFVSPTRRRGTIRSPRLGVGLTTTVLMAEPSLPDLVLLIVAFFSRHLEALAWGRQQLQEFFGPVALASQPYEFHQTAYYEAAMGRGLQKQLLAFERLFPADCLAEAKLRTNEIETELARAKKYSEERPLNLDPGILTLGKFMLATTKDQAHRIYLRDGIYAEVTLRFQAGVFEPWPWTYADYRLPAVRAFLKEARDFYRQQLNQLKMNREKEGSSEEAG